MKIAMIGSKGIPARSGGVEQHVDALSSLLAAAGHEVLVYTRPWYTRRESGIRNQESGTRMKGVALIPLPSIRTKHLDAITHTLLASIDVLRRDVDVVHYHGIGPALLLWIPKLFSRVFRSRASLVVVATFHCQDYHHQKWNWFARLCLRAGEWMVCTMADETIVVSRELERYVWAAYQRRAVYVPNGVHAESRISSLEFRRRWRRSRLVPNGYILFVGRLVRHKGAHTLIEAYRKLQVTSYKLQRETPPLVIVGSGANTAQYEKELRVLARGLPIRFMGEQHGENLRSVVAHARLIVHPSLSEGMSLFLLEAMSSGAPLLASDIPENREVLERSATTFTADDAADLEQKLRWCLTHGSVMARRAKHAQQLARAYTWEQVSDDVRRVYEHALWIRCAKNAKLQEKLVR